MGDAIASQKRKRMSSKERQRRYRQKNQGNLEFKEKEMERNAKNRHLKVLEFKALNARLEAAIEEKEKWKAKYFRLKERLTSAEIQSEAVDIVNLADSSSSLGNNLTSWRESGKMKGCLKCYLV
jgi:hypothetical protein